MWQPTIQPLTSGRSRTSPGTVHARSTRSPERTTTRSPETSGGTLTAGVGPGGAADGGRLGVLPGVLDGCVADDRLVDLEPAVDDVEEHGLARDQVEGRRLERVVLGDDVDLTRRLGVPADRRRRDGRRTGVTPEREDRHGGTEKSRAVSWGVGHAPVYERAGTDRISGATLARRGTTRPAS